MQDLYELLRDYGLHEIKHVPTRFRRMGRAKLAALLDDLAKYGEERRGGKVGSGGLTIAPIGGTMGLGSAEEVVHQTVLYADHLVLRNDLAPLAKRLRKEVDDRPSKGFEQARGMILDELHPYLFQFLAMKPLWKRGMASFAYPAETKRESAFVDDVVRPFLDATTLKITRKGMPWFSLAVGDRRYLATPDFTIAGVKAGTVGRLWESTRERDRTMNQEMHAGDGPSEEVDAEALLDTSHRLHGDFIKIVVEETERLEAAVRICIDSSAHFVTDQTLEWKIICGIGRGQEAVAVDRPAMAFDLTSELAFIHDVPLEDLLELRETLDAEFDLTRSALLRLATGLGSYATLEDRKTAAKQIIAEEVQPALSSLSLRIRSARADITRTSAAGLSVASVSMLVAWVLQTVETAPVVFGMDGNAADAQLGRRAHHADGDLASVRNKQALHVVLPKFRAHQSRASAADARAAPRNDHTRRTRPAAHGSTVILPSARFAS